MEQTLDSKIQELKEALNKFLVSTESKKWDDQVFAIRSSIDDLLNSDAMKLSEEEFAAESYSSYDYSSSYGSDDE